VPQQLLDSSSRLSVHEICKDLGICKKHVYALLDKQVIPCVRIGRSYLITKEAYQEWKKRCGNGRV